MVSILVSITQLFLCFLVYEGIICNTAFMCDHVT